MFVVVCLTCAGWDIMFKSCFKRYKSKCPPPDLSDVIDFSAFKTDQGKLSLVKEVHLTVDESSLHLCGLRPVSSWQVYELMARPGVMFVDCPFTSEGLRYWACRSLAAYTKWPESRLNLDAHGDLPEGEEWWETCNRESSQAHQLKSRLRWATLGYHHNWDTKEYSETSQGPFPKDLSVLSRLVAQALGFPGFEAQAAIVNFYPLGSTLAGHTDHSELNHCAPLLSFSFGCSAVFLIGGPSLDDEPLPLLLRDGDILIMSGPSRLCYHGVPRILPFDSAQARRTCCLDRLSLVQGPQHPSDASKSTRTSLSDVCSACRGQKDKIDSSSFVQSPSDVSDNTKTSFSDVCSACRELLDSSVMLQCRESGFWRPYYSYLQSSRININVRQVLMPGQASLPPR